MRLLRQHGVALVATVWLLALIAGASPVMAVAAGVPLMAVALRFYISELRERYQWRDR